MKMTLTLYIARWADTLMIRKTFTLLALLILGASAYAQTMPEPRTVRISDRVYVLLGPIQHANKNNQGYMINSTVRDVSDGWVHLQTLRRQATDAVDHAIRGIIVGKPQCLARLI